MARIELRGVAKRYDSAAAVLTGIDLTIEDGEFLVLVGPSGCGKSTLLRMIAGLEEISEGDLFIAGVRANALRPRERDLAMVFQGYALYPHLTVRRNLSFALEIARTDPAIIGQRVAEAAAMLGLEPYLDRLPKALSGGQRQRVAMGRALVRRPRAFLFDEPLSNLDASLRGRMRVELKRIHQQLSATSIYVTHDQVEAMTLGQRIALLKDGRILQVGPPDALYHTPATRFVASFLGSPEMGFFSVKSTENKVTGPGVEAEIPGLSVAPGQRLDLGVRPHDLRPGLAPAGMAALTMKGGVTVVEPLGWEAHVHLDVEGTSVVARVEGVEAREWRPGTPLTFHSPASCLHLFDAVTGARV